jgi:hypothetical protein
MRPERSDLREGGDAMKIVKSDQTSPVIMITKMG